jgi:ribosomal protein S12 methylthiotransferase
LVKVNITTLGCPKNQVDSENLLRLFDSDTFAYTDDIDESDILLINTCGFIREAKEESIEEILRLATAKNQNHKKLIVFGCLAKRYKDELIREIPEIDAIFGVGEEKEIIKYCKNLQLNKKDEARNIKNSINHPETSLSSYAYLKIADGCDKKCTFCVIPSIRGRFKSISPEQIISNAEFHLNKGVRELILIAQDITSYGKDLKGYNLVSLLKDLVSINGDFKIRLLYLYPSDINDELIDLVAKEVKIQKYLDIPLQHSEDKILRLMGRRGTKKEYLKLIRKIRRSIPGVTLRTSFIVGFPQETELDFQGLLDFIEEVRFDRLGVFKYSKEEGTPAERYKTHIPEKVKERRYHEIMSRQAVISYEKNKELLGKTFEAIVDEIDDSVIIARLYSHAPEIDGVVIIQNTEERQQKKENLSLKVGDLVNVKIVDAYDYDVKGVLVRDGSL